MVMLSMFVLLGCAVANVAIQCFIKIPDFFNSDIGMTRDSQCIQVTPLGGSSISSCNRILEVEDVKVRICDVMSESVVGKVVSTSINL